MNDLAVEMFLINKIYNIPSTDQEKKGMKNRQVKLSDFDKKNELHFLMPEYFPVLPPPFWNSECGARRILMLSNKNFSWCSTQLLPVCYHAQ